MSVQVDGWMDEPQGLLGISSTTANYPIGMRMDVPKLLVTNGCVAK